MIEKVKKVLKTQTFKHSLITTGGTIVNGVLGMLFYILLARILGPADFGIFSVFVAATTLIADVFDLGIGTGIIRFVGKYIHNNKEKALMVLKISLIIRLVLIVTIILCGYFLAPYVARELFKKEELTLPLRLSLFGAGGALLFAFVTSSVQALQKFWVWSGLNIAMNGLRLAVILFLVYLNLITPLSSMLSYVLIPLLGFVLGLAFLPNFFFARNERTEISELFKYNSWVGAFTIVAAVSSRLDTFISTRLLSLSEVGIYSVANNLAGIVPQIVFALAAVAAPKFASFNSKQKAINYFGKFQLFVVGLSILGVTVGIPLGACLIYCLYGSMYLGAIFPFVILLCAQAVFLISIPAHTSVIYYFAYPKLFVWISLVNLAVVSLLGWYLISNFGYIGAAGAIFVGNLGNFVIPFVWVVTKYKQK